jgi:hypothetical protein
MTSIKKLTPIQANKEKEEEEETTDSVLEAWTKKDATV